MSAPMRTWVLSLLGLAVGLGLGLGAAALAGENPWQVLLIIGKSAFGSKYDLGVTLYYTTPLILTGLAVSVAFQAGLFNIGAEGQLNMAALAAAAVGAFVVVPAIVAIPLAVLVGIGVGALWAWIPGMLRARRGAHEVIVTIMMNFIAMALASWLVSAHLQNQASQNPETRPVLDAYFIRLWDPVAAFFGDAPVSLAFPVAVFTALAVWVFLQKTALGFEIRAVGQNEDAARMAGIDVAKRREQAMALAGACAGLIALAEILGNAGRYRLGFSPDFGFIGIAVALLARNHPLAILLTAFLFGALHKGAADLDIETEYVTRDISLVIQALIILSVSLFAAIGRKK